MSENKHPIRKPLRLPDYDYSQNGCYFITLLTDRKRWLFGTYNVRAIHESPVRFTKDKCIILNENGKICEKHIGNLSKRFPDVEVINCIIMPNHIHLLLMIQGNPIRAIRESPLQRSTLSKLIGYLKMNISKEIHSANSDSEKIWHRNYYDHVIRSQKEFESCWNYIEYNALKEYGKGNQK